LARELDARYEWLSPRRPRLLRQGSSLNFRLISIEFPRVGRCPAQAPFEIGFHSCWRRFAFKNDITTGDVGLDARKPGVAAYDLQFSHWELARSANVHCAHECNILGHVSSISLGRPDKGADLAQIVRFFRVVTQQTWRSRASAAARCRLSHYQ